VFYTPSSSLIINYLTTDPLLLRKYLVNSAAVILQTIYLQYRNSPETNNLYILSLAWRFVIESDIECRGGLISFEKRKEDGIGTST